MIKQRKLGGYTFEELQIEKIKRILLEKVIPKLDKYDEITLYTFITSLGLVVDINLVGRLKDELRKNLDIFVRKIFRAKPGRKNSDFLDIIERGVLSSKLDDTISREVYASPLDILECDNRIKVMNYFECLENNVTLPVIDNEDVQKEIDWWFKEIKVFDSWWKDYCKKEGMRLGDIEDFSDYYYSQKIIAIMVKYNKFVFYYNFPGGGKTKGYIIGLKYVGSCVNLIVPAYHTSPKIEADIKELCPNDVVLRKNIKKQILYNNYKIDDNVSTWIISHFESFQDIKPEEYVKKLYSFNITGIVVDEIHLIKQRQENGISNRLKNLGWLIQESYKRNNDLYRIASTGYPAINNLVEPLKLMELIIQQRIFGNYDPTIHNGLIHNTIMNKFGIRFDVDTKQIVHIYKPIFDVTLDEMMEYRNSTKAKIEVILGKMKFNAMRETIKKIKPILSIHYHDHGEFLDWLRIELKKMGLSVACHTGLDKTGYKDWKDENIDILILGRTATTGLDGMQKRSGNMITLIPPETDAEDSQMFRRIKRPNSDFSIINRYEPRINIVGIGSLCEHNYKRLDVKAKYARLACDRIIPPESEHIFDKMRSNITEIRRQLEEYVETGLSLPKIIPITEYEIGEGSEKIRKFNLSELTEEHKKRSTQNSITTQNDAERNKDYYMNISKKEQDDKIKRLVDSEKIIFDYIRKEKHLRIGNMGSGYGTLKEMIEGELINCEVVNFDRLEMKTGTIAKDFYNTNEKGKSFDGLVYSNSLENIDYEKAFIEASRIIKYGGKVYISTPSDRSISFDEIKKYGFEQLDNERRGEFKFYIFRKLK